MRSRVRSLARFRPERPFRFVFLGVLVAWIAACNTDFGEIVEQEHEHHDEAGLCGHIEASGAILESHGTMLVHAWGGAVHGRLVTRVGTVLHGVQVVFLSPDSTAFAIPDSCPDNRLTWSIADSNVVSVTRDPGVEWTFNVYGKLTGTTSLTLQGWHEDHVHLTVGPIPVVVTSP